MTQHLAAASLLALTLVAGCEKSPETPSAPTAAEPAVYPSGDYGVSEDHTAAIGPPMSPSATPSRRTPIAAGLVRAEWAKAENRAACAPLAFTDNGGAGGLARRANFSGGWAVAFDLPGQRSAYGIAGPGLLAGDDQPFAARRSELAGSWPYAWAANGAAGLPPGSFAGFGIEGRGAYGNDDPQGRKVKSLAYLIVPGQRCQYNVWTTLGRDHLETLLAGLTTLNTR